MDYRFIIIIKKLRLLRYVAYPGKAIAHALTIIAWFYVVFNDAVKSGVDVFSFPFVAKINILLQILITSY
jgi:hypothetical protein